MRPDLFGTDGLSEVEARKVRVMNVGALIGVVVTLGWALGHQTGPGKAVNFTASALFLLVLLVNRAGLVNIGRHGVFVAALSAMFGQALFSYVRLTNGHLWLLAVGLLPLLIFGADKRLAGFVYCGMGLLMLLLADAGLIPSVASHSVADNWVIPARLINMLGVFISLLILFVLFLRETERAERESERLLLNVLPEPIARRLKSGEDIIAQSVDDASVLFADIVGFTTMAANTKTENVVALLNEIFTEFDRLADRHGVEKIKTIGDAYMAAAGVPLASSDHARAITAMALEMRPVVATISARHGYDLDVRIGINSGPVVAGVIGRKKFAYDLWGDVVNTAARMESHGRPGEIQISLATAERLGDGFAIASQGMIQIKGKGELETFFVLNQASGSPQPASD